jgi:histidinol-phosphate aminotransferase
MSEHDRRPLTRPDLAALPPYVPGRSPADLARELGIPAAIKLASNEVPYGPLPGVTEAISTAMTEVNRYPDAAVIALRDALAERYEVAPDRIVTGCGSVGLLDLLCKSTCQPGDEIVYSWRSFEAYPLVVLGAGARSVQVPNKPGHGHDLDAMLAAITPATRLVLVCNPNNPTGTALHRAELTRFLDAVSDDVLVVLDEAYREFITDEEVPDGLVEFGDRPNVVVLRTMSKAWGLAGLRCGWLVASPEVANTLRTVLTPFATNMLAQAAAIAALHAADEMRRRVDLVLAERDRLLPQLRALVPDMPASQANFFWLPVADPVGFGKQCESHGVIVRPFPEGVRVTIGTPEENDAFLAAARG